MFTFTDREAKLKEAALLLKALANANRLNILDLVSEREIPVFELAELTGITPSAVSQHLTRLHGRGLVKSRRERQNILYQCDSEPVKEVLKIIRALSLVVEPDPPG